MDPDPDPDPDLAFFLIADPDTNPNPDLAFFLIADPDPAFFLIAIRMRMQIQFRIQGFDDQKN